MVGVTPGHPGARMRSGGVRRRAILLTLGFSVALAIAGCGSSSSSSSSSTPTSTSTTSPAATPKATPIAGVASPANAAKPAADTLKKLKPVPKAAGFSPHLGGLGKQPLPQQIQTVSGDINHFWSQEFASSGVQWPPAQDVLVQASPVQDQCNGQTTTINPTDNWALCDTQSGVTYYWTVPWMQQHIATDTGGVMLAFSMAEVWSLHIQNLIGSSGALQQGSMTKANYAQQTMCLTGIYAHSLAQRNLFEQGDANAEQAFLNAATATFSGITAPDVTPQQLMQALLAGYQSGQPSTCGVGGGTQPTTTTTTTTPLPTTTTTSSGIPGTTTTT